MMIVAGTGVFARHARASLGEETGLIQEFCSIYYKTPPKKAKKESQGVVVTPWLFRTYSMGDWS